MPCAAFTIEALSISNAAEVSFFSHSNLVYMLEISTHRFDQLQWQWISDIHGTGYLTSHDTNAPAGDRKYRIRIDVPAHTP